MHMTMPLAVAVLLALASANRIPTLSAPNGDDSVTKPDAPPALVLESFHFLDGTNAPTTDSRRRSTSLPTLKLGQAYPDDLEYNIVGPVTNPIYLGTPDFEALVSNVCAAHEQFSNAQSTPEQLGHLLRKHHCRRELPSADDFAPQVCDP